MAFSVFEFNIKEDKDDNSNHADEFISKLREEAKELKECFTKYIFQSIGFVAVILGIMVRFGAENPILYPLGTSIVLIILISLARLGVHKYGGSNRIYGYVLHLKRFIKIPEFQDEIKNLSWEESMRAWRIVQPSLFNYLYTESLGGGKSIRKEVNDCIQDSSYVWFLPEKMCIKEGAHYHTGRYFWKMLSMLILLAIIAILLYLFYILRELIVLMDKHSKAVFFNLELVIGLVVVCAISYGLYKLLERITRSTSTYSVGAFEYFTRISRVQAFTVFLAFVIFTFFFGSWFITSIHSYSRELFVFLEMVIFCLMLILLITEFIRNRRYVELLESEFLSIHSCAIVWHCVLCCHAIVLRRIQKKNGTSNLQQDVYFEYHKEMARLVAEEFDSRNTQGVEAILGLKSWIFTQHGTA